MTLLRGTAIPRRHLHEGLQEEAGAVVGRGFAVTGFAKNDRDGKGDKSHGNPGRSHDDDDDSKSRGQSDQMGWKARQVTREDKRGYRAADESMKSNNWEAIASQIDFPVLMVTDDARGEGNGSMWNREQWLRTMK